MSGGDLHPVLNIAGYLIRPEIKKRPPLIEGGLFNLVFFLLKIGIKQSL